MKSIKNIMAIIAMVAMILGVCFISMYSVCQTMLSQGLMKIAFQDVTLSSVFDQQFPIDQDTEKKFEAIKEEITDDPQLQQIMHDYSMNIMDALATGEGTMPDLDGDLKAILEKHEATVKALLPVDIPLQDQEAFVDFLLKDVDLQPIYDQAIQSGRQQLSPNVLKLLNMISWLASSTAQIMGFICLIGGLVVLVVTKWQNLTWLRNSGIVLGISGIGLYGTGIIAHFLQPNGNSMVSKIVSVFSEVSYPKLNQYSLWLLSAGIISIIGYVLIEKLYFEKRK